ncbi:MAG: GNAT family N-acetyltransferase [Janthinobacterium lividum]
MTTIKISIAQPTDAPAIAALANQHTYQQLDAEARRGGFLTGAFSVPGVQAMLASVPGQVAYQQDELAGFVLNSRLSPAHYPPLVQEIIALLPQLHFRQRALATYRWFFYGPVLVQPAFRGHGLLPQLFQASHQTLAGHYELGIAFIAEGNTTSLRLHIHKLGLEVVGQHVFEGTTYVLLVFLVGAAEALPGASSAGSGA